MSISIVESSYFRPEGYSEGFKDWIAFWMFVLISGIFTGIIGYYIKGIILFLGVKLAGGKATYKSARTVMLFAGIPIYFAVILIENANMVFYLNDYFTVNSSIHLDIIWMTLKITSILLFFIFLVNISISLFQTSLYRSILILCILPIVYNLIEILMNDKYMKDWTKIYKIIPLHF